MVFIGGNGFPGGASGKESTCQFTRCKRHGFDPWVGKIPWSRKWQPTSFLAWKIPWTEEPAGLQSQGCKKMDTTEQLTLSVEGNTHDYDQVI